MVFGIFASLAEFELLPGVIDAVARLKAAGLIVIVATNQPDVARGEHRQADVDAIHKHLKNQAKIDDIYACYCLEGPDCDCYKPKPGMLRNAALRWDIDLARSFMVGGSLARYRGRQGGRVPDVLCRLRLPRAAPGQPRFRRQGFGRGGADH
ncbi:MAG: HAD-IIIA family hydrolase [Blastochloris sp.]|nr:HAD-IIIA family hydrolase [Blastochloris sp.]